MKNAQYTFRRFNWEGRCVAAALPVNAAKAILAYYFALCLIGHAAAEAAALPAIAAHYILYAFSSATFGAEEGTGRSDVYLTRLSLRLISSIRSMGFTALAAVSRLTLISGHSYLRQLYSLAIVLSLM